MDLVDTLRNKIATLDDGDHMSGLKATLGHIEVAFRHLARGQSESDQTAFTDAIYRTNQAFEGSIKEAYRVLTGKDPHKKTTFSIEEYLEKNDIFRDRVLNQFKNYRTEWRNPSTHDYKLYFDESEAFLAIISVSAFACLLSDQIASKIAFEASKAATKPQSDLPDTQPDSLYHQATKIIRKFASTPRATVVTGMMTEAVLIGSLHGAFSSAMPNVDISLEPLLSPTSKYRADLILKRGEDKLLIELKRFSKHNGLVEGRERVERYLEVSGLTQALLVFMPDDPQELDILEYHSDHLGADIRIFLPSAEVKRTREIQRRRLELE